MYPPSSSKVRKPELTVFFLQESPTSLIDEGVRKEAPSMAFVASEGEAPALALGFILTSSGLSPQFLGAGEDDSFLGVSSGLSPAVPLVMCPEQPQRGQEGTRGSSSNARPSARVSTRQAMGRQTEEPLLREHLSDPGKSCSSHIWVTHGFREESLGLGV